jgi:hypothetical protein
MVCLMDGTTGSEILSIPAPTNTPGDSGHFGVDVEGMGNDAILVGAYSGDGAAYLFNGASGELLTTVTNHDPQAGSDGFAHGVGAVQNKMLVGHYYWGPSSEGRAYLFDAIRFPTTEVWLYWGTTDGMDTNSNWANTNSFGVMGAGALSTNIGNLSPNTTYYYRYYASNSFGASWATPSSNFTTLIATTPPVITNDVATNITASSAYMNGELTSTGGLLTEVWLYYGITDRTNDVGSWSNSIYLGTNGAGALTTNVTDLFAGTKYFYRYYATNALGDDWGTPTMVFTTLCWKVRGLPRLTAW